MNGSIKLALASAGLTAVLFAQVALLHFMVSGGAA